MKGETKKVRKREGERTRKTDEGVRVYRVGRLEWRRRKSERKRKAKAKRGEG